MTEWLLEGEQASEARAALAGRAQRWVVKIGSALLTNNGRGVDRDGIAEWVRQIHQLRESGAEVLLVSSGAVAAGMDRLGWTRRPDSIHQLQAAAAVGQSLLVQLYEECFRALGGTSAQVLLDHDDLSNRRRYLNARSTLRALLQLGVVPIINENDTVVTDEIRFGDNDTLAALVANLVEADGLLILTDTPGLFSEDPRDNPDAQLVSCGRACDPRLAAIAGGSRSGLGRGGMQTKVSAAALAARSGASTIIAGGTEADVIRRACSGEAVGTLLLPEAGRATARKRWLAGQLQPRGELRLDAGAARALLEAGSSLLAVGITSLEGDFQRGDPVICRSPEGGEIARGLVNYPADELRRILGQPSSRFEELLGYRDDDEVIHRDNLALV
ncbi:glutamate 5-kinase [Biformimicrobium ophioploci]|uniref:Glutamate 5-kinase n=1 Tax=Biformimicrobium ophioploci TaxID=3036711 RepID=A0ABQ6M2S6_9GAMM|nr:glutamate 5-kinase [Microbulbifer sp. NKW57]GMG88602.1 glutamate 5-kinase [Microbulbifer sp. NKW57]